MAKVIFLPVSFSPCKLSERAPEGKGEYRVSSQQTFPFLFAGKLDVSK